MRNLRIVSPINQLDMDFFSCFLSLRLPTHWHSECVQRNRRSLMNTLRMRSMKRRRIRTRPFPPHIGHAYESERSSWGDALARNTGLNEFTVDWPRLAMPISFKKPAEMGPGHVDGKVEGLIAAWKQLDDLQRVWSVPGTVGTSHESSVRSGVRASRDIRPLSMRSQPDVRDFILCLQSNVPGERQKFDGQQHGVPGVVNWHGLLVTPRASLADCHPVLRIMYISKS
jgi:hypothetical protein